MTATYCSCLNRIFDKCGLDGEKITQYIIFFIQGIQHVLAMMGSNVLVPLITDIKPAVAMFSAGLCTIAFHFLAQRKVPTFLGSSFAFVGSMQSNMGKWLNQGYSRDYVLGGQQLAVFMTGILYLLYSLIVYFVGPARVKKIFPPVVVGPVIMVIGLTLAPTVIGNYIVAKYTPNNDGFKEMEGYQAWLIAITTAVIIIGISTLGRGLITIFPVLFGIIGGYIISACFEVIDYDIIKDAPWVYFEPDFLKNVFGFWGHLNWDWNSIAMFCPLSIVTFMEHLGDITSNGAVVGKNFFEDPGLHRTLLGDGFALLIAAMLGGPAITTYGENTGVLAMTKNYNPNVILLAGIIAAVIGLLTKISGIIESVPSPVIGGASMIMFGVIASMGLKVLIINQVNITKSKNMMIAALILVIGIGFKSAAPAVDITIETVSISPLAVCTLVGIFLNLLLPEGEDDSGPQNQEDKKELEEDELSTNVVSSEGQDENEDDEKHTSEEV